MNALHDEIEKCYKADRRILENVLKRGCENHGSQPREIEHYVGHPNVEVIVWECGTCRSIFQRNFDLKNYRITYEIRAIKK